MKPREITVKNLGDMQDTRAMIIHEAAIDYIPKISVIMPVYNTEKYLRETLETVINQTLKDFEIICIDDGSTDNSLEILKEYASKDNRITLITQENLYASTARNAGLSISKGKYLSFLDSDDLFMPHMLETLYTHAEEEKVDVVACQFQELDNETNRIREKAEDSFFDLKNNKAVFTPKERKDEIFQICPPAPWNKLFRKELFTNNEIFYQSQPSYDDTYVGYISMALARKIKLINDVLITYRIHRQHSIEDKKGETPLCFYYACKQVHKDLIRCNVFETYEPAFYDILVMLSFWVLTNTKKSKDMLRDFMRNTLIPEYKLFGENKKYMSIYSLKRFATILDTEQKVMVTLTSSPEKINTLHEIIESILYQTKKPDKIILGLPLENFPNKNNDLPISLTNLISEGLVINYYSNLQSYKKLMPPSKNKQNKKNLIIEAKDEEVYNNTWLEWYLYDELE